MKIMLEITPEELELLMASRYRIEKYHWEAMREGGEGTLPYHIEEYGPSTGGLVAGFMEEEDAKMVATMYSVFRRVLSQPQDER